ncbi:MAG: P-II family nitrogen regulator [Deltaproteobacteria bacterium]
MKMIIGYINPYKVDEVRDALKEAGVSGMSVSNIQGFGRQAGHTETYRGAEYEVDFVPKVRVEVLVDDTLAPTVISALETTARTGSIGDGKIAVIDVEDVIRIRTGERGRDAL